MDPHPERFSTYGSYPVWDRRTLLNGRDLGWGGQRWEWRPSPSAPSVTEYTFILIDMVLFESCNRSSCTLGTELNLTMPRCL